MPLIAPAGNPTYIRPDSDPDFESNSTQTVRTYGNPYDSPGQRGKDKEPGRVPDPGHTQQPGHAWSNQFVQYWSQDSTIVRDRHAYFNRGNRRTGGATENGGGGYGPDPLKDGPPMPYLNVVNRTFNPQQGYGSPNQDDLTRGYRTVSTGQWAGTQDGSSTPIWGGTPGLWQPYGSYAGYARGPVQGIQGPEMGAQGDGRQMIPNSPPHGLHSETMQNAWPVLSRFNATKQQQPGRVDRPANSPIAGQSFSQTVLGQNQISQHAAANVREGVRSFSPLPPGSQWRGA